MAPSSYKTFKTLIPWIIVFFIFGVVVGYVAYKPVTIEKIVTVTPTPTQTPIPTSTPSPAATATRTPTPTRTTTPTVDFIVKDYYNPSIDIPSYTIQLRSFGFADPNSLYIHQGESVLIKITDTTLTYPMTIILNSSYSKKLGVSGAAFVTFNNKGEYMFQAIIPSSQIGIKPRTYAEGTITVR